MRACANQILHPERIARSRDRLRHWRCARRPEAGLLPRIDFNPGMVADARKPHPICNFGLATSNPDFVASLPGPFDNNCTGELNCNIG